MSRAAVKDLTASATLEAAILEEQRIADEATLLREDTVGITPALFLKLRPLLRKPFHEGFIKTIGIVTGKPYASTGIKSVQVQHDRMNNVLTEIGWDEIVEYHADGKLAHVIVRVLDIDGNVLVSRESWGGVDRGSTQGNLRKGSYTNAAKIAFARLGPGHEVYIGATGFDPDVDEDAAKEQAKRTTPAGQRAEAVVLSEEQQMKVSVAMDDAGLTDNDKNLWLAAVGAESFSKLTVEMAYKLREKLDAHAKGGQS